MASKVKASTALVLSLNLLFFALVSSHNVENPVFIHPGDVYHNGRITHGHPGTCNPLNLGVCVGLLGLVDVVVGNVPTEPCCSVIEGLVDLEAAVCLCTAVRANVLGIPIHLPISLSLLLNKCGREVATEYICSP
ncbi:hypothetical protein CXB51_025397 [Gossypium anomalum]|uniref:Bifunctional inhibitor/plant lipid transfer protein/seed storage helical domain-containing protein n=1 Tax=Gossypium anomalum TaxID=47600 RepID=A0A8J5YAA5_9ROSI|nr:hypothetical protein CXB51_025397 [Gossypium anomalum]